MAHQTISKTFVAFAADLDTAAEDLDTQLNQLLADSHKEVRHFGNVCMESTMSGYILTQQIVYNQIRVF
jgi:hypothetical protein